MAYDVHLCTVGKKPDTAFSVFGTGLKMKKLYLLNNEESEYLEVEKQIIEGFRRFPLDAIEHLSIKIFDFHDVFNKVIEKYNEECELHRDVRFHINITMGTSITVGALCSAAYSINADLYYVQEGCYSPTGKDEIILVDIDNIFELADLRKKKKTCDVFRRFGDRKPKTNVELMGELNSLSSLTYHTRYLCNIGLIQRDSVRNTKWSLTQKGEQVMKRL